MISQAVETTTVYFPKPGRDNTEETLRLAKKRAEELGIKTVLIATTRGDTGVKAVEFFPGYKVIMVTHSHGFKEANAQEVPSEARDVILQQGGIILTATHTFGGVGRAVRRRLNTYQTEEFIAFTLRIFGEGMKVVAEMAAMAADAGLVRTDEEVVAIAGTGRGADTAVVLQPANAQDFFNIRIKEIICKPRL